jgi:hypothetical protein
MGAGTRARLQHPSRIVGNTVRLVAHAVTRRNTLVSCTCRRQLREILVPFDMLVCDSKEAPHFAFAEVC